MLPTSDPPADPAELKDIVDLALHGDAEAWKNLYVRLRPRLLGLCVRRLGDRHDAEDAVAETMLRAVRGASTFSWRGAGFDAWVFRICRNVLVDMTRSRARQKAAQVNQPDIDARGVDEPTVLAEEHAAVRRAFDLLGDDERELLELRVVAGLSSDEVAHVLGRRAGAVRMAQSRALARLRANLAEDER